MTAFSPAIREFLAASEDARRIGAYRCKDLLDKAGTAPIFKAVEEHGGLSLRDVAIKLFDIGKATKEGSRVLDEARSLCRVQHPNVIRFHTLATDPKRGIMGIVMEFAEGVSVAGQLKDIANKKSGDARRVPLAVEIGLAVASALAAAHDAGVVHCNVKPSNIMFTGGTHKLINFGIAASLRGDAAGKDEERGDLAADDLPPDSIGQKAATLAKAEPKVPLVGTIGYVDPVCLKTTSAPTSSSDLYSLGATLYECVAGDVPALATAKLRGGTTVDRKVLVGDAPPAPLAEAAPGTPAALAKLVDSLVAPKREARPRSAEAVVRSLERIRSVLAGRERALPAEERGPFPGFDAYGAADRDVFFGRSAEIAGVLELLKTRGLVGIVGLSGTGKTSLVRAGVVPQVEEGALGGWPSKYRSVDVTPGTNLMAALRKALGQVLGGDVADHPEAIAEQLAADVDKTGQGLLIVVDQLEDLASEHDPKKPEDRKEALDLLARLAEAPIGLRVVVTARQDRLDDVLALDPYFARALSRGIQLIGPLTGGAWEEVLDQALEAYGYTFDGAGTKKDILAELRSRESAMPLAQFGLTRLWAGRDAKKKTIPHAKGSMKGALESHADASIASLDLSRDALRDLLLALTTPEGTRAHVPASELAERFGDKAKKAIAALVEAHVLTEDAAGVTFVHDSLLTEWSLVRAWLSDWRDDRILSAQLERDASRWAQSRDVAELWRKGRLAAGLDLQKRASVPVSDTAKSFLAHSAQEEQRGKIIFGTLAALIVLLIVGGSLVLAKESRERAVEAQRHADELGQALAQVKTLKQQAEEAAGEAAASAELIQQLQKKMAEDQAAYGAQVQATIKKVASATSLDGAQKAADDLKGKTGNAASSLVPLPLAAGPKLDTGGPSPSGGGAFDQASIERVVNSRKAGVKRTCLDRSPPTASSTKVTTTLTIAPNGSVANVSSAGDDPVMAKCIEQQLRTWSFPAPGETKTVQIPFVFVRQ